MLKKELQEKYDAALIKIKEQAGLQEQIDLLLIEIETNQKAYMKEKSDAANREAVLQKQINLLMIEIDTNQKKYLKTKSFDDDRAAALVDEIKCLKAKIEALTGDLENARLRFRETYYQKATECDEQARRAYLLQKRINNIMKDLGSIVVWQGNEVE